MSAPPPSPKVLVNLGDDDASFQPTRWTLHLSLDGAPVTFFADVEERDSRYFLWRVEQREVNPKESFGAHGYEITKERAMERASAVGRALLQAYIDMAVAERKRWDVESERFR